MRNDGTPASSIESGDFPYPLSSGPQESCYLRWLRNHSNYMATRGLLDYFRIAGVLARGILLNFSIVLPMLLLISLLVGHLYGPQLRATWVFPSDREVLPKLAERLRSGRPIDAWMADKLERTQRALKETAASTDWSQMTQPRPKLDLALSKLKPALLRDLDTLVDGELVHSEQRFERVTLSPKTEELLGTTTLDGAGLRRLNRMLLEDAYPELREGGYLSTAGRLFETIPLPHMPKPFIVTGVVSLLALLWIVISPVCVLYGDIAGRGKSSEKAAGGRSLERRDLFERTFGVALVAILAIAAFELLPILVGEFHHFRERLELNWEAIFASVAGVSVAVLGGAGKLLSTLGGAKKKLAMLLIGLLGVLGPLLVILYVTEFLVYASPLGGAAGSVLAVLPGVFVLLIAGGMAVGWFRKTLRPRELLRLLCLQFALVVLLALGYWLTGIVLQEAYIEHGFNHYLVLVLAAELAFFCWLAVDVNRTSIHGLYRDRLASAYLVGRDTKGNVAIENDVSLGELAFHEAGSSAPYHLLNVCLNLQASKDPDIRDRASDFFIFSKRFIGGRRTGYCRTGTMEQVHPSMSLATAMAISAAAASPNMGQGTNPAIVAFMVLLNIRLGYWLPNPGLLEESLRDGATTGDRGPSREPKAEAPGFAFHSVFAQELLDIERRWDNAYTTPSARRQRSLHAEGRRTVTEPSTRHGLVGIGLSGGGIRSATVNLGIVQTLHARGIFGHADYLSTVSGGGYLGASISTLMRRKTGEPGGSTTNPDCASDARPYCSPIAGRVHVDADESGDALVTITGPESRDLLHEHLFSRFDQLLVSNGDVVEAGQALIKRHDTLWDRLRWRVHPWALVLEMMMRLDEAHRWVNISDGGHIENLAGIELLRRRCKYIVIGDAEADPDLSFNGLAKLIRYARIDLGIRIDIHPDAIRVVNSKEAVGADADAATLSREHCAFGTVTFPPREDSGDEEIGYLLYLKSSCTGDEDEVISEYRRRNPSFPHQSTADQFFDENQFECYRALGQHIAEKACEELSSAHGSELSTFDTFTQAMETRAMVSTLAVKASQDRETEEKVTRWSEDLENHLKKL